MKNQFSRFLFGFLIMVLTSSGFAENLAILERYPSGSIQTVERANQALEDVKRERDVVQESFLDNKDDCLQRFFVSSCLNKAKEVKRQANSCGLWKLKRTHFYVKIKQMNAIVV